MTGRRSAGGAPINMLEALRSDEAVWDLFVKKEEYQARELDEYGRFLHKHSKFKDVMAPWASKLLIEKGFEPSYPRGSRFAVCLTHDIDMLNPSFTVPLLNAGRWARRVMRGIDRALNPRWNFGDIMDLESSFDARSTFFFLAIRKGERTFNYYIEDLADEIRDMRDRGWSVGLHGGYEVLDDPSSVRRQKEALEKVAGSEVLGYRNHYLRFRTPSSWEMLEEAGFAYDTTFGYPDHVGFRNGMCHPFRPFNDNTGKLQRILEIPLVVMDGSLLSYMNLDEKRSVETVKRLVDTVCEYRGVLTVLWHNVQLAKRSPRRIYEELLEYSRSKNAWLTSTDEMYKWWSAHDFMREGG